MISIRRSLLILLAGWFAASTLAAPSSQAADPPVSSPATSPSTQPSHVTADGPDTAIQQQSSDLVPGRWPERRRRLEKGAYLGVAAVPVSRLLGKHLGLARGVAMVVDLVSPDSPAAKAGVQADDVLLKLDDQLIINREQLAVLVRSHRPGAEVKLSLIRDGKPIVVTAKLAEHDLEALGDDDDVHIERGFEKLLPEMRIHPPMPGDGPQGWAPPGPKALSIKPGDGSITAASVTWIEADRSYTVMGDPSHHMAFTVKDRDGKQLFSGPIDTPEQREAVPKEFRDKLDHMRNSGLEIEAPADQR